MRIQIPSVSWALIVEVDPADLWEFEVTSGEFCVSFIRNPRKKSPASPKQCFGFKWFNPVSFSSYCGKNFKSKKGREDCEQKCSGNKQYFECPTCSKKLTKKSRLLAHMKTHTGERNIGCPLPGCNSAYYTKFNLATHIKLTHKMVPKEVFAKHGPPILLWKYYGIC